MTFRVLDKKGNVIKDYSTPANYYYYGIQSVGAGRFYAVTQSDLFVPVTSFLQHIILNKNGFTVLRSLANLGVPFWWGVASDGKDIYHTYYRDVAPDYLLRIIKRNKLGNLINRNTALGGTDRDYVYLCFDGRYFWLTDYRNRNLLKFDWANQQLIDTVNVGRSSYDICFDGRVFYAVSNLTDIFGNNSIDVIDRKGNIINTISAGGGYWYGITTDGKYLYLTN